MVKISFSLQDSPDDFICTDINYKIEKNEMSVAHEQALAILINEKFPNLKKSKRRIKNLIVIDENGDLYETKDFDIYGSLKKKEDKK
jgi:hypothetical protein